MARKTSRVEVAIALADTDPSGSETSAGRRLPLEDLSLDGAFYDRIDETAPRFPPGDDHEGRVSNFD